MAVAKKCDRCGKFYEGLKDNTYQVEGENGEIHFINSLRIGNWNQKTKSWVSIASAYDLCRDCGREIYEAIFDKGDMKMRMVKKPEGLGKVVATADPDEKMKSVEQEQAEMAAKEEGNEVSE